MSLPAHLKLGTWTLQRIEARYASRCHLCGAAIRIAGPCYLAHGTCWCIVCCQRPSTRALIAQSLPAIRRQRSRWGA